MTTLAPTTTLTRQVLDLPGNHPATTDVHALHRLVMAGYCPPGTTLDNPRAAHGILFAAQRTRPANPYSTQHAGGVAHRVLVQADQAGDWTGTPLQPVSDPLPVDTTTTPGDLIQIAATIAPTRTLHADPNPDTGRAPRGTRIPLRNHNHVAEWLTRRFTPAGIIHLDGATITGPTRITGTRGTHRVTHHLWDVMFTLTITNPDAFTTLTQTGVGGGKAYGAGLIRHRHLN